MKPEITNKLREHFATVRKDTGIPIGQQIRAYESGYLIVKEKHAKL